MVGVRKNWLRPIHSEN